MIKAYVEGNNISCEAVYLVVFCALKKWPTLHMPFLRNQLMVLKAMSSVTKSQYSRAGNFHKFPKVRKNLWKFPAHENLLFYSIVWFKPKIKVIIFPARPFICLFSCLNFLCPEKIAGKMFLCILWKFTNSISSKDRKQYNY